MQRARAVQFSLLLSLASFQWVNSRLHSSGLRSAFFAKRVGRKDATTKVRARSKLDTFSGLSFIRRGVRDSRLNDKCLRSEIHSMFFKSKDMTLDCLNADAESPRTRSNFVGHAQISKRLQLCCSHAENATTNYTLQSVSC